jgi:hypothetical protein
VLSVLVNFSMRAAGLALIGVPGRLGLCSAVVLDNWLVGAIACFVWAGVLVGLHGIFCSLRASLLESPGKRAGG